MKDSSSSESLDRKSLKECQFPHDMAHLWEVRRFAEEVSDLAGLAPEKAFDLKVAVSEAAANAMEHSRESDSLMIRAYQYVDRITVTIEHGGEFRLTTAHDRRHRGLGLPLMATLCDELTVARRAEGGICVTLSMRLSSNGSPD
jgi:serine/threonine-protein kinase RsbW